MSETLIKQNPTLIANQLPILPETQPSEPLVQCGVLYLGSGPTGAGLRGLDSVQEPLSHRYPVDGTNTVRGIDAVLSIYDNGIQLIFIRQPHAVVFFPISSLIYCASLRFTVIENDQTKLTSIIDWRFMPLDTELTTNYDNKHPPLFCISIQRTQILPGEECHCFITKSSDAAIELVRTISQVYGNLQIGIKSLKSPIFYQLDRYGRKISEITGVIYISPANDDNSKSNQLTDETIIQNYLFDPSYDGFFYRTDASIIEQWQLWDDDHLNNLRPHPPASPFGLHEGLYHDDTTDEIQRYLRQMDEEDQSCSCSSSNSNNSSCKSSSSISTKYSRKQNHKQKFNIDDTDQFNVSFSNLQTSSFEPNIQRKKPPIIIEKILPKSILPIPILNPKLLPKQSTNISNSEPILDSSSLSYYINEHGEKITKDGNKIVFMDVVQMNTNQNQIDSQSSYKSLKSRHHSKGYKTTKHIPIIDIQTIEKLYNKKTNKKQRKSSINIENKSKSQLSTPDQLEIIEQYFDEYQNYKLKSHEPTIQSESSSTKKQQQLNNITSPTNSSKSGKHHRRSHSALNTGSSINYIEHPKVPSLTPAPSQTSSSSIHQQKSVTPTTFNTEKLNQYVSDIYGTARSIKSASSATTQQDINNTPTTTNAAYFSAFRYMQSSINRNLLQEYRNVYS